MQHPVIERFYDPLSRRVTSGLTECLSMDSTSTPTSACNSTLTQWYTNACDPSGLIFATVRIFRPLLLCLLLLQVFVCYDLPFKLERSCVSGRRAQTVSTRPQDSHSKSFRMPPTVSKTSILATLGCLAGYVCISGFSSCFASTFAAQELRNDSYIPSFSP